MKHIKTIIVVLALILVPTIAIASTTVMIDHSRYLRVYLSSESTVEGRPTFIVPLILGTLETKWQGEHFMLASRLETISLFPDNFMCRIDYGYFEGQSYNRYLDISTLSLLMEWNTTSGNLTTKYYMSTYVNTTDGKVIWNFHNDTWTFGWRWRNYYSDTRTQDHYLYEIRDLGLFLLGLIGGSLSYQVARGAVRRMRKKRTKTTTSTGA